MLESVDAQNRLAAKLATLPDVRRLDTADEPQAHTLAYTLAELEESCRAFLDRRLPDLVNDAESPDAIAEVLTEIGEELRHLLYHAQDPEYFSYLRGWGSRGEGQATGAPNIQIGAINMDCADARAMADFYTRLLGWEIAWHDHDFILLRDPDGGPGLSFQEEPWYQPPVWPEQP
jgi:hypothetical protein